MPEPNEQPIKSKESFSSSEQSPRAQTTSVDFQSFDDSPEALNEDLVAAKQLLPGELVADRYEIVQLLSSGGMGSVYKALHRELGKFIAIKVLLVDKLVKDVTYRRFEREAKAAGSLSHPNIVSVYDYGLISADRPYIVMELLDGINLDDLLAERGYLTPGSSIAIFTQVCDALAHAHTRGLIHRDLKPSNIMLIKDDKDRQRVKIIDFGIAKFATKKPETRPITKPGQIFGSPLYMSPEQCVGQKLDARADIYSLGCVMYEALCGAPPFIGDTLLSTIYKHVNEPPPPLSEHIHGRNIPAELERAVMKMLEKQPEHRFQSADEVLQTLEHIHAEQEKAAVRLADEPTILQRLSSNRRFRLIISIAIPVLIAIAFKAFVDRQNSANQSILPWSRHHSSPSNEQQNGDEMSHETSK
jgi:serine/threonine protein kinase